MRSQWSPWLLAAALFAVAALPASALAQGWLGVTTQPTNEDLRRGLDLTRDGLLVNRVLEGSPAERAGLRKGDVILRFDGRSVTDPADLRRVVRDSRPGDNVTVEVWRNGSRRMLDVEVGEAPASESDSFETPAPPSPPRAPEPPRAPRAPRDRAPELDRDRGTAPEGELRRRMNINGRELGDKEIEEHLRKLEKDGFRFEGLKDLKDLGDARIRMDDGLRGFWMLGSGTGRGRLGVRIENLTRDLAQAMGVSGERGVLVLQVHEDTPAQKAGLRAGDVIVRVGNQDVADSDELVRELGRQEGKVDLGIVRRDDRRTVEVDLPERGSETVRGLGPGARSFNMRIPETPRAPRVYRRQGQDSRESDALREELRQLRRELEELRREMGRR
jgi:membrane-associated protease RseP (regulator of RpoE activity)